MKTFSCRHIGWDCDFVARGSSTEQVLELVTGHARDVHKTSITPDLANRIEWLVLEERSGPRKVA